MITTDTTTYRTLAGVRIADAGEYDLDHTFNLAGYQPDDQQSPRSVCYRHRTGSTAAALYDEDSDRFTSVVVTAPVAPDAGTRDADTISTIAFTGATPLGVVVAALTSQPWQTMIRDDADLARDRRAERITELRAELPG